MRLRADSGKRETLWIAAGVGAYLAYRAYSRRSRFTFHHKTVLITGGSRGLGLVLARQLADEGARLAICARDRDELEEARQDLLERGAEVVAIPCDLTEQRQVEQMVRVVEEIFGGIDVLINNAGVIQVAPLENMTVGDYEEAMKVNFWASLYTCLAVLPGFRERSNGRIVNIASIGGKVSVPHLLPYSASKFALTGFSEGLRSGVAKDGITVTTIIPGLMRTGSPRNAKFKGQNEKEYAWFAIADALPLLTVSAEHAARQILGACRRGEAETTISIPAKLGIALHQIFPRTTMHLLGLINEWLPGPGRWTEGSASGKESESPLAPSALTALGDRAAERNNEVPGATAPRWGTSPRRAG